MGGFLFCEITLGFPLVYFRFCLKRCGKNGERVGMGEDGVSEKKGGGGER